MAIAYYEKALQIAKDRKDELNEKSACMGLGYAYRENDQIQSSVLCYKKALEIAKKQGDNLNQKIVCIALEDVKEYDDQKKRI